MAPGAFTLYSSVATNMPILLLLFVLVAKAPSLVSLVVNGGGMDGIGLRDVNTGPAGKALMAFAGAGIGAFAGTAAAMARTGAQFITRLGSRKG